MKNMETNDKESSLNAKSEKATSRNNDKELTIIEVIKWDLVLDKIMWCKWLVSAENGLFPIESLYV